jgi:hypothetical protein
MPRPRKYEIGEYDPGPPASSNGGNAPPEQPWLRIAEISVHDIPVRTISRWTPLYRELLLRLEQTPAHLALAITFCDEDTLRRAHKCLVALFRHRHGPRVVAANAAVLEDGKPMLYIRRGENWSHRHGPPAPADPDPDQASPSKRTPGRPRRTTR